MDDTADMLEVLYESDRILVATTWRAGCDNPASPYSGFSVCRYTGDSAKHTDACMGRLAKRLGSSSGNIIMPRQTHSCNVAEALSADLLETDAVILSDKGYAACVNTADCVPIILVDAAESICAAIHAGWRGAIGGIIQKTITAIRDAGATRLRGFIGSCICRECFEVGEEVASLFPEERVDRSAAKPHVDLSGYVSDVLGQEHVEVVNPNPRCTRCESSRYFSARRLGINSGRNLTFAYLKP